MFQLSTQQKGRQKLETLRQATLSIDEGATFEKAIDELLSSALEQGDELYLAAAYKEKAYYSYYNVFQPKAVQEFTTKSLEIIERIDKKDSQCFG